MILKIKDCVNIVRTCLLKAFPEVDIVEMMYDGGVLKMTGSNAIVSEIWYTPLNVAVEDSNDPTRVACIQSKKLVLSMDKVVRIKEENCNAPYSEKSMYIGMFNDGMELTITLVCNRCGSRRHCSLHGDRVEGGGGLDESVFSPKDDKTILSWIFKKNDLVFFEETIARLCMIFKNDMVSYCTSSSYTDAHPGASKSNSINCTHTIRTTPRIAKSNSGVIGYRMVCMYGGIRRMLASFLPNIDMHLKVVELDGAFYLHVHAENYPLIWVGSIVSELDELCELDSH